MTYAAKRTQLKLTLFAFFTFIAFFLIEPFIQFAFFIEPLIQFIVGPLVILPLPEPAFILELEQQIGLFPKSVIYRACKTGAVFSNETS